MACAPSGIQGGVTHRRSVTLVLHTGLVVLIQPAFVFPDTNAPCTRTAGSLPGSARFDSRELWGADAEQFALTIEMFESYLEEAG
jgi:hypothetical protein